MISRHAFSALAASVALAGAAPAQTPPQPAPGHVQTATTASTSTTVSKPAIGAAKVTTRTRVRHAAVAKAPMGKVVAITTKSGKTLHYDCGKPGNKNKTACKG